MKHLQTTEERKNYILQQLKDQASQCLDENIQLGQLQKHSLMDCFLKNDKEGPPAPMSLDGWAETQLLARLNIPASYIHRCPNHLKAANFNYWINQQPHKRMLVRYYDNTVRAIFSSRYNNQMDDLNVIPPILEALQADDLHIQTFDKMSDFTFMRCFYRSCIAEKDGLKLCAGVVVTNSEVGKSALWIKPTVRGHSTSSWDFLDSSSEGSTRIQHTGTLDPDQLNHPVRWESG